jgi:hypothetical protein
MSIPPASDDTVPAALQEGLALVLNAEDGGDWKAVIDWLARNPSLVSRLVSFIADQQGIKPFIAPLRVTAAPSAVGKYELREVIGKGAMGVVYRAFDPTLKREVAVKLLHPGGELSADDRARFRFEAEAVAALDHPNVVKVYESGESDGVPFLVMPLLTGGSLAGWLKGLGPDRKLKPMQAAEIARDIALGIQHAHQQGLIHRDLKPANILRDDTGQVRVADFGLARVTDVTATRMAGTPAYMAPEQVGSGKRLTTAVDGHAVGAILFELLAGGPPFGGSDVGSVLRKVADEPAPAVRTYRPDVPRDLEAVVAKCLEKKPEDRYPSALALAEDLDNFRHGRPVTAGERGTMTDLARALGYRAEPKGLFTWRGFFVGSVSTAFALTWVQAAVLLDGPRWVSWAGLGYYLVSWATILWVFLVLGRRHLRPVDRANAHSHIGMLLGAVALTPISLWLHAGEVAPLFAPLLVIVGLGLFAGGSTIAGRYYLEGGLIVLVAALLPLVPVKFWPGVYGLTLTLSQLRHGLALRRYDRASRAALSP